MTASRSAAFLFPLLIGACASTSDLPVHPVHLQPLTVRVIVPRVTGYLFRELGPLVRRTIVEDFRTTVGEVTLDSVDTSGPLVVVTVDPQAFGALRRSGDRFSNEANLQQDVVWFHLKYTIRTADGVVKRGVVAAEGPSPDNTRSIDNNAQRVVASAVVNLRRRVSRALSAS
jgi:hypothetical protein